MIIELDYNTKSIEVDETIVYQNNTGQPLSTLVLAVEPNLWWQCFTLEELHIDGVLVTDYLLDGQRFEIPLAEALQPTEQRKSHAKIC